MSIGSARSNCERGETGLACVAVCLLALALAAPAARSDCGDCTVRVADFPLLKQAYLCVAGSSCYDPRFDYDSSGRVGVEDLNYFKQRLHPDVTPPVVSILSPIQGQILSGRLMITVSASDDVAVASGSIFFEGVDPYPPKTSGPPYRLMLDTRTIPNGMQVISANAVDAAGNRSTHRVAVRIANPVPPPSVPGLVIADDLNGDGGYTGQDLKIALARCAPGCTLRALARTYDDVELVIPAAITYPVIIEGAGMGRTVFRSPVPWQRPVITVGYPNRLVTVRDLSIDGRKAEQLSSLVPREPQVGIQISNPWASDSGPGVVERVEIRNMLNGGVVIGAINGWIVRYSRIHDNGCSHQFPCPSLRSFDPGAALTDPTWQSVGYGIVAQASDTIVHDSEIWNINKIGIEAFDARPTKVLSGFHFHHNYVHHTGSGIGSNGGSEGLIEANVVTFSRGHGVFCGALAGDLVFRDNLISDSGFFGLWVSCSGSNLTVANNRIGNNCQSIAGGGSGLLVDAPDGDGITIQGNFISEPRCRSASEIYDQDGVEISGNDFRGGTSLGTLVLGDLSNVVLSDTRIDAESRVPACVFLLPNIDGLTIRPGVTLTGYTQRRILVGDPASVNNVVVE